MKLKIKKGATVQVISGAERGRKGSVLSIDRKKMRIKIQGVNILTKHSKQDGIVKEEGYIHYSNVKMLEAPKAKTSKTEDTKEA